MSNSCTPRTVLDGLCTTASVAGTFLALLGVPWFAAGPGGPMIAAGLVAGAILALLARHFRLRRQWVLAFPAGVAGTALVAFFGLLAVGWAQLLPGVPAPIKVVAALALAKGVLALLGAGCGEDDDEARVWHR